MAEVYGYRLPELPPDCCPTKAVVVLECLGLTGMHTHVVNVETSDWSAQGLLEVASTEFRERIRRGLNRD